MARAHQGYDVYLGPSDGDLDTHPLVYPSAILYEDPHAKVVQVKARDERRRLVTVFRLTDTGPLQRNVDATGKAGSGLRWEGVDSDGVPTTLTAIHKQGGCIPCGRR